VVLTMLAKEPAHGCQLRARLLASGTAGNFAGFAGLEG
jgi:hypothetical protein